MGEMGSMHFPQAPDAGKLPLEETPMTAEADKSPTPPVLLAGPNARRLGAYSARMTAGDYDAVYEFFPPGFSTHVMERTGKEAAGTDIRDIEARYYRDAKAAFPDARWSVEVLIERDDFVVSNWTLRGTHTGAPFMGIPASGREVIINGTAILRFEGGKIVEHWGGPHCARGIGLDP